MTSLFNDEWQFAELPLDDALMVKDGKPVLLNPVDFIEEAKKAAHKSVRVPHDWMISHVKELYKNSIGSYVKSFEIPETKGHHFAVRFEGVYMNSAVFVNDKLAGIWKYGYGTFEFDITPFVVKGKNEMRVIAVYQNCNTRWYSGAGIFRDVSFRDTASTFLVSDGTYIVNRPVGGGGNDIDWVMKISTEVAGPIEGHTVRTTVTSKSGQVVAVTDFALSPKPMNEAESSYLKENIPALKNVPLSKTYEELTVTNPTLWDVDNPYLYTAKTELFDRDGNVIDCVEQNTGFKTAIFTKDDGFFLNGRHLKITGACHHHDHGLFGAAFDVNALRRQFNKLKEMGVNSVRCSHNPPPKAWMDLCDEMGILVDDEAFDMWEKPKTPYDYGNYFNEWHEKDTVSWVRKDRNHPSLIMWSIGNEIYDTHMGNGLEITKDLRRIVKRHDPEANALVTIASNYMMTDGAQDCGKEIETVGYNYLERLYDEHHKKYPGWCIYGSETGSTVQSRGIYHFPDTLKLVTFSDMQCSTLGNCTTTWGCANTQTVIANDRDCLFSAGQYIWTGWDYIGEPTPYHSKNSYFGQIDTAGFPKDTFYLYKSEWAYKKTAPFVHILPYWDWNEGQIIDVKAYSNAESVELFFNGKSLGKQEIDHVAGAAPFGQWQLSYAKGELKAVGYDENGKEIACEVKKSFTDPVEIVLEPETADTGDLFFIDIMTADKDGTLVENARNYITINVSGDAELVGMDNGDSTDYDEYQSADGHNLSRKLFQNRLVAAVRAKKVDSGYGSFTVTAASQGLPTVALTCKNGTWSKAEPAAGVVAEKNEIPVRKIEIICNGKADFTGDHRELEVTAKVLPENATYKEIEWQPMLKECVSCDYIEVTELEGKGSGCEKAVVRAVCDGECILRLTANNGRPHNEILSDLNFAVTGVGNPKLNPYKLIEGCRFDDWDQTDGKVKPTVSLESGISNRFVEKTWVSYSKVDFGVDGADTIHIPIFSFMTELPVEVWDGKPGEGGVQLLSATYKHESVYNTFNENVFTLPRRLFGVHTIAFAFKTGLEFKGFYFDQTKKALSKLCALDANDVIGDSFTKTEAAVEGIGNNVNLDFANMDFGDAQATRLTICGKSNTENNTINVKFFDESGASTTQVIEFAHTDDYEEKTFEIEKITGKKRVSFVFLPGCNFDFKWFRFSE